MIIMAMVTMVMKMTVTVTLMMMMSERLIRKAVCGWDSSQTDDRKK